MGFVPWLPAAIAQMTLLPNEIAQMPSFTASFMAVAADKSAALTFGTLVPMRAWSKEAAAVVSFSVECLRQLFFFCRSLPDTSRAPCLSTRTANRSESSPFSKLSPHCRP